MSIVKLSNSEVEILDQLSWGQNERVQAVILEGAKMNANGLSGIDGSAFLEAKYRLLEIMVQKITLEGGEELSFSRDWIDGLSVEDGNKLYEAVDAVAKKK